MTQRHILICKTLQGLVMADYTLDIDGLVQERRNAIANALGLSRVYTPCARMRRLSAPSAYASIRRLSPSKFKHVELSRPAQTSAGIPTNHGSAPRSPRADTLLCIGTHTDVHVHRRIRSRVYTFIHGATCVMQWRRTGKHKRGHLRRLPAHTRAWSINPALRFFLH